jgi:phosphoglycerate dehydrogenase-like enzyme
MSDKNIVVTFKVREQEKEFIDKILGKGNHVFYLKNLDKNEWEETLKNADVIFSWNPTRELKNVNFDSLSSIKFVQLLSAGYDHVDLSMFKKECQIASNSGAYAEPMAEHVLAMILALSKNLLTRHLAMAEGKFDQLSENNCVKGKTCGIIGFGGIGKAAADLLRAFGTKIFAINTSGKTDEEVDFIGTLNDLDYLLKESDIIIITIPLIDPTRGLINKSKLGLMKSDAIIINVARGAIINQKDLYEHLKSNPNFRAGIDAWWSEPFKDAGFELDYPFFDLPNILGSPHNSAVVPGGLLEGSRLAVENIKNYLSGEKINGLISR